MYSKDADWGVSTICAGPGDLSGRDWHTVTAEELNCDPPGKREKRNFVICHSLVRYRIVCRIDLPQSKP